VRVVVHAQVLLLHVVSCVAPKKRMCNAIVAVRYYNATTVFKARATAVSTAIVVLLPLLLQQLALPHVYCYTGLQVLPLLSLTLVLLLLL
jgi:hypothetical protein